MSNHGDRGLSPQLADSLERLIEVVEVGKVTLKERGAEEADYRDKLYDIKKAFDAASRLWEGLENDTTRDCAEGGT